MQNDARCTCGHRADEHSGYDGAYCLFGKEDDLLAADGCNCDGWTWPPGQCPMDRLRAENAALQAALADALRVIEPDGAIPDWDKYELLERLRAALAPTPWASGAAGE